MTDKIKELKSDIEELEQLLSQAKRQKVKDILSLDVRKLQTDLTRLNEEAAKKTSVTTPDTERVVPVSSKCYQVKLNNYAWDQSANFIKFYVTLSKVQTLPPENIVCKFTNRSLELHVKGLENKDYTLMIKNLLKEIDPQTSTWRIKTDMVLINAAKVESTSWSHVTELEKRAKDAKKMVPDSNEKAADPSESLMSMMRNMYEQGDDDLKRTIAKAWTESQEKGNKELF